MSGIQLFNLSDTRLDGHQIKLSRLQKTTPQVYKQVKNLVDLFIKHNQIKNLSEFDWALFAYRKDYHNKKFLIVIKAKIYGRKKKNKFPTIRQGYFLLGRKHDNSLFVYRVNRRVISRAIVTKKDIILAILNRIFRADYREIIRQGDICLIPLYRGLKKLEDLELEFSSYHRMPVDNHNLYCDRLIEKGEKTYVFNPRLQYWHLPEVPCKGWFKMQVLDNFKGKL